MILKCMENIYLVAISHESLIKMGGDAIWLRWILATHRPALSLKTWTDYKTPMGLPST